MAPHRCDFQSAAQVWQDFQFPPMSAFAVAGLQLPPKTALGAGCVGTLPALGRDALPGPRPSLGAAEHSLLPQVAGAAALCAAFGAHGHRQPRTRFSGLRARAATNSDGGSSISCDDLELAVLPTAEELRAEAGKLEEQASLLKAKVCNGSGSAAFLRAQAAIQDSLSPSPTPSLDRRRRVAKQLTLVSCRLKIHADCFQAKANKLKKMADDLDKLNLLKAETQMLSAVAASLDGKD